MLNRQGKNVAEQEFDRKFYQAPGPREVVKMSRKKSKLKLYNSCWDPGGELPGQKKPVVQLVKENGYTGTLSGEKQTFLTIRQDLKNNKVKSVVEMIDDRVSGESQSKTVLILPVSDIKLGVVCPKAEEDNSKMEQDNALKKIFRLTNISKKVINKEI